MKISAELLYHLLKEKHTVAQYGNPYRAAELPLPVFYQRNTPLECGRLYIARTQDLPQLCNTSCLFICIGNRPAHAWSYWQGSIYHVNDATADILSLFNTVNSLFDKVERWNSHMQKLLDQNADIEEYVRISIPLFGNSITISDYDLCILVDCQLVDVGNQKRPMISKQFNRIPDSVSQGYMHEAGKNASLRQPFYVKGNMDSPDGNNYCINLYLGDNYVGTCSLRDSLHPIRESDCLLFQQFAEYARRALSVQSRTSPNQPATFRTIFFDLLQSFPVSKEDLSWAMNLQQTNMKLKGVQFGQWQCIVIQSANREKTLPAGYLCTAVENLLPHTTVVAYDDMLVCYRILLHDECEETGITDKLLPYLSDMNFRAGISTPFEDIFKARNYYQQAKVVLQMGSRYIPGQYVYRFKEQILPYMLQQSVGEFNLTELLTPGLQRLMKCESGVDYFETLRRYLENECNASKTAQDLHLHRSSLLPRLEKIKTMVDLDTPEQRLYLRMCIALCDLLENQKNKARSV